MDKNYPNNAEKRPKRRHDKYNPYRIFKIDNDTGDTHFFVTFDDGQKVSHCLEIDKDLYEEFDKFERDDLSFMNEVDRHYEHSELTEASLNRRAFRPREDMDETLFRKIEKESLYRALDNLPEVQRRRLILYYFDGFTYQQIAVMENCKYQAVCQSVAAALKNLKKFLL